jgi:hypothetical protein
MNEYLAKLTPIRMYPSGPKPGDSLVHHYPQRVADREYPGHGRT